LSGDGTITARVTSLENTDPWAKAGVMIRETLNSNSRHASTMQPRNYLPQTITRTSVGGSTSTAGGSAATFAARWVRLTKSGNSFTSQYSTNGTTWTTIATRTVTFANSGFYVGLGVTSHEASETNTTDDLNSASFSNVSITGFSDPLTVTNSSLAAPTNLAATLGTGNAVALSWTAVAGATGYSVERSSDAVTFLPIAATTSATTFTDANPLGSQQYWYRVRATNASGRSDVSTVATITNRPSAVRNLEFTSYTNTSIVLDWFDTDGESGFKVERSADGGTTWTTLTSTLGKNIPSYTASGLAAGTAYTFRVTPTSTLGDGASLTVAGLTRLPAITSLALGTITSNSINISWADIAGETGYRIERSTDGTTFTNIGTVAANVTSFSSTGLTAANEYYFRVVATAAGTESTSGGNVVMAGTTPTAAIPSPWIALDIGTPATTRGSTAFNATTGTFTVISGGADIWGTSDQFRFTYQQLTGNGVITARVASTEDTGQWAKIGVMVRESLNANSRHSHMMVTPGQGISQQSRTSTGGNSTSNFQQTGIVAPYWVRMIRKGNVLSGYYSSNGTAWTLAANVTISGLASTVFVGLSANANTANELNTSTFSNVSVFRNAVESVTTDDGTSQRSVVRSMTVRFNGLVTLPANPASAFTVTRSGVAQPFTVSLTNSTPTQTVARLNFTATGGLTDGLYVLTVLAAQVTDASSFALGTMAANRTENFHRLFGDSNGDRTIDGTDFTAFGNAFGTTNFVFDLNRDSTIDGSDLVLMGNRFGRTI
jgi:hypothetical protein